jgi:hypothetical protein
MPDQNNPANQNQDPSDLNPQGQADDKNVSSQQADVQDIQSEINQVAGSAQQTPQQPQDTPQPQPTTPKPVVEETSAPPPSPSPSGDDSLPSPPPQPPKPEEEEKPEEKETLPPPPTPGGGDDSKGDQPPPDIPPVVTSPKPKKKFGGKKVVATILGILFLIGGIGAGVILVQNQQDIRERAYDSEGAGTNACEDAGGTCVTARNCSSVGRYAVNGGAGCTNTSQVCCSKSQTTQDQDKDKEEEKDDDGGGGGTKKKTTNACEDAGGTCVTARNCSSVGRYAVNGGAGCTNTSQVCCSKSQTTPSETTHPNCNTNKSLYSPSDCSERLVKDHVIREFCNGEGNVYWCKEWQLDYGVPCWCDKPSDYPHVGKDYWLKPAPGQTKIECGSSPDPRCTESKTPAISAACLEIKAFDTEWNRLSASELSNLKAGDTVRFTVAGTATSGSIDKARFTINGVQRAETTSKRPQTNEFYDEYTIPEDTTSFTIGAQIHHSSLGWF